MPKHNYPDNVPGTAADNHRTGKITGEFDELQFAEDLFESGAYTNGMLGI